MRRQNSEHSRHRTTALRRCYRIVHKDDYQVVGSLDEDAVEHSAHKG
jgi:hypothetical protein